MTRGGDTGRASGGRAGGRGTALLIGRTDYRLVGGGTDKVVMEETSLLIDAGFEVLYLCPMFTKRSTAFSERWVLRVDGALVGVLSTDEVVSLLGAADLSVCLLHHTYRISTVVLDRILGSTRCLVVFFVHDFATVCVSSTMMSPERGWCGLAAAGEGCSGCSLADESRELFERHVALFRSIGPRLRVVAPSRDAAERWRAAFSDALGCRVDVRAHLEELPGVPFAPEPRDRPRLAFVGNLLLHKGSGQWDEVVSRASGAFELYHFGSGGRTGGPVREIRVDFHGGGASMVDALLGHGIDCAFLYSQCPETFSYTFHECLSAQVFVVTSALSGNIARQVRERGNGIVFDDDAQMLAAVADGSLAAEVRAYRSAVTSRPVFEPSGAFMEFAEEGHAPHVDLSSVRRMWPETATYWLWGRMKGSPAVMGAWRLLKKLRAVLPAGKRP